MPWRSSSLDSRCRARIRSPRASSRARTRSRAASCSTLGTVTATDLAQPQQPGQMQRVPGVGLHPIPGRALQLRRCRHHTLDPGVGQVPGQPEPGRPGLIGHRHRARQPAQPAPDLLEVRATAVARHSSPVSPSIAARDHRPGVHIQTNTRTLMHHWGLLPTVALPDTPSVPATHDHLRVRPQPDHRPPPAPASEPSGAGRAGCGRHSHGGRSPPEGSPHRTADPTSPTNYQPHPIPSSQLECLRAAGLGVDDSATACRSS